MKQIIQVGSKEIGQGLPAFIIAEAGSNHDRKIEQAKKLIDVAAAAGVDAVKFQLFTAEGLYKPTDAAFEIVRQNEFPRDWLKELVEYSNSRKILFLATPFDLAAVEALERVNVSAYKLASSEVTNASLIKACAQTGKPIVLSTAMSNLGDIEQALEIIHKAGNEHVVLLQCSAMYPTPVQEVHLRTMDTLKAAFQVPVGFSDHTLGILMPPVAVARGACVIEKHFTLNRALPGPDHSYAIEPDELKAMVKNIRDVEASLGSPYKQMLAEERKYARRESIFAVKDISGGEAVGENTVEIRRPAWGIDPRFARSLYGMTLKKPVKKGEPLTWEHLMDEGSRT